MDSHHALDRLLRLALLLLLLEAAVVAGFGLFLVVDTLVTGSVALVGSGPSALGLLRCVLLLVVASARWAAGAPAAGDRSDRGRAGGR